MTNAIIMNSLFPFVLSQNTDQKAKAFIGLAKKAIRNAELETNFGDLASNSTVALQNKNLTEIALWHYDCGLRNFREAISNLEQAKKFSLSAKYRNYVDVKISECYEKTKSSFACKQQTEFLLTK